MWTPDDKASFVLAFKDGRHNECVGMLAEKLLPNVRRHYENQLRDPYLAGDLAQDLMADVLQSLPTLREPAAVAAWFKTCADNHLSSRLRKKGKAPVIVGGSKLDDLVDPKTPRSAGVWTQRKGLLQGIERLKATDAAIVAFRLAGWSHDRIADLLNITVESAKKRFQRAVRTMRTATHKRGSRR